MATSCRKARVGSMLEKVSYEGQPAIAWWQGSVTETAYGLGEGIIANTAYEPIAHVKAGNGLQMDIHELNITPARPGVDRRGRARLRTGLRRRTPADPRLRGSGDRHQHRHGDVGMEPARATSRLSETEVVPANGAFDPYHMNSIQPIAGGNSADLDARHLGRLPARPGRRPHHLADRRQEIDVTRARKARRFYFQHDARLEGKPPADADAVRRRGRPARVRHLARADPAPRKRQGEPQAPVPASLQNGRGRRGKHAAC